MHMHRLTDSHSGQCMRNALCLLISFIFPHSPQVSVDMMEKSRVQMTFISESQGS